MGKNLKVLCSGCSFSESQPYDGDWIPWTDLLSSNDDYDVVNLAKGSAGQFGISNSIMTYLLDDTNFKPDYIIVQWSSVIRGFSKTDDDLILNVLSQTTDLNYIGLDYNSEDAITMYEEKRMKSSLQQILLLKTYIESIEIPYLFFWGWKTQNHTKLLDKIVDSNWWYPHNNKTFGLTEHVYGQIEPPLLECGHPTSESHQHFYDTVILPRMETVRSKKSTI